MKQETYEQYAERIRALESVIDRASDLKGFDDFNAQCVKDIEALPFSYTEAELKSAYYLILG